MKWWLWLLAVVVVLGVFSVVFDQSGGRGLTRIVFNYLLVDIPDKKYSWTDFVPSSTTHRVVGFYSPQFSGHDVVAIWTLVGLKRYYHKPWTSVYYFRDTCAVVKEIKASGLEAGEGRRRENPEEYFFELDDWRRLVKSEYLVTMQWVKEGSQNMIDKAWSQSGRYKVLGRIEDGTCE